MTSEKVGAISVSVLATIVFGAVVVLWMLRPPSVESPVLNVLVGALAGGYGTVLNYWLGSSAGSSRKDATIQNMAATAGPTTPTT